MFKCSSEGCENRSRALHKSSLCTKCNSRKWRKINPDKSYELNKLQYLRDRTKILRKNKTKKRRKYKLNWHHANKERFSEKVKAYCKKRNRQDVRRFYNLKASAKARNIEVSLTEEDWLNIITDKPCTYCGKDLEKTGSSVDRIDNNLGYTKENITPCCVFCNKVKFNHFSFEETIEIIKLIKRMRKEEDIWKNQVWPIPKRKNRSHLG